MTNLQQVVCRRTLLGVDLESQVEEIAEDVRQVVFIFDGWCPVRGDQVECPQRRFCQVGWLALYHFNRHDTKTPNIDLATILLSGDHLGCHPVRSADHSVALVLGVVDLRTEAEVSYSGVSLVAQ